MMGAVSLAEGLLTSQDAHNISLAVKNPNDADDVSAAT